MRRRIFAFVLMLALALTAFAPPATALAETNTSIARVYLKYLGNPKSQSFTINGYYSIAERSDIKLEIGKSYTVSYTDGASLSISDGAYSQKINSTRLTFKQHSGGGNIKANSRSYDGDMVVDVFNSGLRMINRVYLETYLKGVVPYEIGNSSPIEAIKAQAVAARSYALIKMKNNGSAAYDLVDDDNDQVYGGLVSASNCASAVDATKGQVLLAPDGSVAYAFYSSTNGGYMETGYVGGATTLAYYQDQSIMVKPDPMDGSYTNPAIYRKSLTFPRDVVNNKLSTAMMDFLHPRVANVLAGKGYKSGASDYKIVKTTGIYFTSYDAIYTESDGTVRGVARTGIADNQKLVVNIKFVITVCTAGTEKWDDVEFTIPMMFGALVTTFKPSNTVKYRMGIIETNSSSFVLSMTRSGHGVGMSQTGAINRGNAGQNSAQILSFYYPNLIQGMVSSQQPALTGLPSGQKTLAQLAGTTQTPDTSAATGTVNTPSLNVRTGPAATYASVGVLAQGSKVMITGMTNGWYSIQYAGTTCYVSAVYVVLDDPSANIPGGALGTGNVSDEYVLVMDKPDANASVVYVLTKSADVSITESEGAWYKITWDTSGSTGYVPVTSISLKAAATPTPTPVPTAPAFPCFGILTSSTLTMRDTPSTSGTVIATIKKGDTFYLTEQIGNWYKAMYNGKTGYLSTGYVSRGTTTTLPTTSATPTPTPSPNTNGYATGSQAVQGTVTSSTLNVRREPTTTSTVIKTLAKNNAIAILGETNGFYRIGYGGGFIGYASKSYITKGTNAISVWNGSAGLGKVNATNLNVRSGASTTSAALGQLANGSTVLITAKSGVWYMIPFGSGSGYVREDFITNATPKTCTIVSSTLTIRSSASSSAASLAVVPKGQTVYYYGKTGAWAIVGYGDKFGYAAASNVTVN